MFVHKTLQYDIDAEVEDILKIQRLPKDSPNTRPVHLITTFPHAPDSLSIPHLILQ